MSAEEFAKFQEVNEQQEKRRKEVLAEREAAARAQQ